MNKNEVKNILSKIIAMKNNFDIYADKLLDIFPGAIESELFENFYKLFDSHCELISKNCGIPQEAIEWFVYDNICGANKFEADGTVIDCLDTFVDFEFKALEEQKNGERKNEE